jgi:hypothetical protein
MKQTPHQLAVSVNVAEGPAAESCDRDNSLVSIAKAFSIFPQNPPSNVSVLEMFIARRTYGWTTGKTGLFLIRKAEGGKYKVHSHVIKSENFDANL